MLLFVFPVTPYVRHKKASACAVALNFICHMSAPPCRDGPDASSPQLGVFSGNTALESAYSSSSKVLIRFHSDFSTGGFFILNFHGTQKYPFYSPPPTLWGAQNVFWCVAKERMFAISPPASKNYCYDLTVISDE